MKRKIRLLIALPMLTLTSCASMPPSEAPACLGRPLPTREIKPESLFYQFFALCEDLDVPCGFESARSAPGFEYDQAARAPKEISRAASSTTSVCEFLDLMVHYYPSYQWRYADGVLTLRPRKGEHFMLNGRPRLDGRVGSLQIAPMSCPEAVIQVGHASNATHTPPKQGPLRPIVFSGYSLSEKEKVLISFHNERAYQALNGIVRTHGRAIWYFAPTSGGQLWLSCTEY